MFSPTAVGRVLTVPVVLKTPGICFIYYRKMLARMIRLLNFFIYTETLLSNGFPCSLVHLLTAITAAVALAQSALARLDSALWSCQSRLYVQTRISVHTPSVYWHVPHNSPRMTSQHTPDLGRTCGGGVGGGGGGPTAVLPRSSGVNRGGRARETLCKR